MPMTDKSSITTMNLLSEKILETYAQFRQYVSVVTALTVFSD